MTDIYKLELDKGSEIVAEKDIDGIGKFIKLDRRIIDWEWYKDEHTKSVFIHCLLKANWKDGNFKGKLIPRGSFVTSLKTLRNELDLTEDEIRTALKHLILTKEITKQATNKYTIITVKNYELYQNNPKQDTTPLPNNSHSIPILFPTIEEEKEYKKGKNNNSSADAPTHSFVKSSNEQNLDYVLKQYHPQVFENIQLYSIMTDWMSYKDQRKPKSQNHYSTEKGIKTLINQFLRHNEKFGTGSVVKVVEYSIGNNYAGLFWDKFQNSGSNYSGYINQQSSTTDLDPKIQAQLRALEERQNEAMAEFDNLTDEQINEMCRGG